jgi:hypothetical protein
MHANKGDPAPRGDAVFHAPSLPAKMKILRYQGLLLQVERLGRRQAAPGARIVVREWEDGRLELRYRGNKIAWQKISSLPVSAKPEPQPQLPR